MNNTGSQITGIGPSCFGSVFWTMIHMIAIAYPEYVSENDPIRYKIYNFYKSLEDVIPCGFCQEHYRQNFPKLKLENYLDSRILLFQWTYELHNIVNKQLGKSGPSFEEAYSRYNSLRSENCSSDENIDHNSNVCNNNPGDFYCKVEFLSKKAGLSNDFKGSHIINIVFFVIILLLIAYILYNRYRLKK